VPKIPDEFSLGGLPSLNSGRPIATYDETPIGKGVAALGQGLENLGTSIDRVQREERHQQTTEATATLQAGLVGYNTDLLTDNDYTTMQDRHSSNVNQLRERAASGISDPEARRHWLATVQPYIEHSLKSAQVQALRLSSDAQKAYLGPFGEDLIKKAMTTADPVTRTSAIDAYGAKVDALIGQRQISAVQGMQFKRSFAQQYATADAMRRMDQGDWSVLDEMRGARPAEDGQSNQSIYAVLGPQQLEFLLQRAERVKGSQLLELNRQDMLAKRQRDMVSEQAESDIRKRLVSDDPNISLKDIVTNDSLTREAQDRLIHFSQALVKPEAPAKVSSRTTTDLLDRIRLPEGDPNKITDLNPIYDQFIKGNLTKADFQFVTKEFQTARTPEGDNFLQRKKIFIDGIRAKIDKSNPLMIDGIDAGGKQSLYVFEWDLDKKIEQYRKDGKNPYDLLDPAKPDYMGKPQALEPYQKTLTQSIRDRVKALNPGPAVGSRLQEVLGAAKVRIPGETADDYLRRTGVPAVPVKSTAPN
jgi:hypothetical protein